MFAIVFETYYFIHFEKLLRIFNFFNYFTFQIILIAEFFETS